MRAVGNFDDGIHAMLTPATPSAAFGIGEKGGADPVEMYLNDVFTVTVNMAGLPGVAVRGVSARPTRVEANEYAAERCAPRI